MTHLRTHPVAASMAIAALVASLIVFVPWTLVRDELLSAMSWFFMFQASLVEDYPRPTLYAVLFAVGFALSLLVFTRSPRQVDLAVIVLLCALLATLTSMSAVSFSRDTRASLDGDDPGSLASYLENQYTEDAPLVPTWARWDTLRHFTRKTCLPALQTSLQHSQWFRLSINGQPATSASQCKRVNRMRWMKAFPAARET